MPIRRSTFIELGIIWMPAPIRANRLACSYTCTSNPKSRNVDAAVKPPMPAPTIAIESRVGVLATIPVRIIPRHPLHPLHRPAAEDSHRRSSGPLHHPARAGTIRPLHGERLRKLSEGEL